MKDKKEQPMKPKTSAPPVGAEDSSSVEEPQERKAEKFSLVPKLAKELKK
jgi:hypothetical protein